jgi:hypothetical protein
LDPTTGTSAEPMVIGFMNAALGLRLLFDFLVAICFWFLV